MGNILYNGTSYGGGGSSSEVEANPSGTATDTLETIGIEGTIYDIAGSGGEYSETSLWSGSDSATMQLSESFENYNAIMVIATASTQRGNYRLTNIWSVDYLKNHINDGVRFGLTGDAWYVYFSITNNTTFTRQDQNITYISEIKGLKFGGGGGGEGGYEQTNLYINSGTTQPASISLSQPVTDFDAIMIESVNLNDAHPYKMTNYYLTDSMEINNYYSLIRWASSNEYVNMQLSADDTFTTISSSNLCTTRIVGINYCKCIKNNDISDMTWTQLISQTGGSWSAATAIPSGTEYLGIAIDHSSAVYMPKTLKLSELDKYASMLNYTIVREGIHWKHNTDQDDIYYEYDSANQTIKVYAGYSGLSVKVFAIS